jgi:hypothetical protein
MRELEVAESEAVFGGDHTVIPNEDSSKDPTFNNPGNIVSGDFATRHGANGSKNGFATFPTYLAGREALYSLLDHNYGDYSFNSMFSEKYNPDDAAHPNQAEVEHDEIQKWITDHGGTLDWNKPLSQLTDMEFYYVTQGIIHHEGRSNVQTDIVGSVDDPNRPGPDGGVPDGQGSGTGFVDGWGPPGTVTVGPIQQ